MLITRQNPNGGRPLREYPIDTDQKTGRMGFKIGYCVNCAEPILLKISDADDVARMFVQADIVEPKVPLIQRLKKQMVEALGGTLPEPKFYDDQT